MGDGCWWEPTPVGDGLQGEVEGVSLGSDHINTLRT